MRVLGVDPGLTRCGLGVVDGAPGRPPAWSPPAWPGPTPGDDIAARLLALEAEIDAGWPSTGRTRSRWSGCSASTTCAP